MKTIALLLGLAIAAPVSLAAAETLVAAAGKKKPAPKKDDKKKKGEEKKEEGKVLKGPAAQPRLQAPRSTDVKDTEREALADKKRDESIESLKKIIAGGKVGGNQKAELLFQLAELWWEKSKHVFGQEMAAYDKSYAEFMEKKNKGEARDEDEPKLVTRQSELYRKEAVKIYADILKGFPSYERRDEVLFTLGYNLYEMGQKKEAVGHYATLIKQYPESRYYADTMVQLGNHYFDENDLSRARRAFEKALELKSPRVYSYALYKLAWCDFNGGDYEAALNKFKEVVDYQDRQVEGAPAQRDRIQLKAEALKDMILTFVQMDAVDEAMDYYKTKISQAAARDLGKKLMNAFFDAGKNEQCVKGYKRLIAENENDAEDPTFQSRIIQSFAALQRRDQIRPEMEILVEKYKPTGAWAKVNASNKGALATAYEITEGALYELVTDYHKEAINTKSVDTYVLARDIYKKYIDNFPESQRAYSMRYLYAEILWALEDFEGAAPQYETVRDADPKGQFLKPAAYNAVLAIEKLVAIAKGELEKKDVEELKGKKIDEKKAKEKTTRKQILEVAKKDQKEEVIPDIENKLVAACDRYVQLVPGDEQNEIILRYKAAFLYYDHFHFVEAADRFGTIINKWPTDQWAQKAADLILDSLNVKEEWSPLNKLARSFQQNKKLSTGEFATRLHKIVEGSQFKIVMGLNEQQKFADAAVAFREFVKEFPKSEFADKALFNAMVIFDKAEQLDWAIEVGEQLLAEYDKADKKTGKNPDDDNLKIVKQVTANLGAFYERTSDFETAIKFYLLYQARWDKDEKAADMLFNAGLWYEGLGNTPKAIETYQKYMKNYDSKPDVPDIFFNVGLILERDGKGYPAAVQFDDYLKKYKSVPEWKKFHGKYKLAMLFRQVKRDDDANRLLRELLETFPKLKADEKEKFVVKDAAAHAKFLLLEPKFNDFLKYKFEKFSSLKNDLKKKAELMAEMEKQYTEVVAYGSPSWAIAALTRIGMAYKDVKETILKAPEPKGLDEEQREMYVSELENRAFPIEEKSIEAFEKSLDKSFELGVYNEWTLAAEEELLKFKKDAFGDVKELPYFGSEFFFTVGPEQEPLALKPTPKEPEAGSNGNTPQPAHKAGSNGNTPQPAHKPPPPPATTPTESGAGGDK